MPASFFVLGSINTDLNVSVEKFPAAGETVTGSAFSTAFGGKGANQAVALSRLCADSDDEAHLAGKTGSDAYGIAYREHLKKEGVNERFVGVSERPTGTALIEVDGAGMNRIVVVPGANADLDIPWWLDVAKQAKFSKKTIFLFQLEIPVSLVARAMRDARDALGTVILDPAPATVLPKDAWENVDFVTPNQSEAFFYTGIFPTTDAEALKAAQWFFAKGVRKVIIKAGGSGSWLFSEGARWFCPAFPVNVVDTTAAGDSFNAGLAWALGNGKEHAEALRFANAVGGLSTTRAGAQDGMPRLSTVEALLQAWPKIVPRQL